MSAILLLGLVGMDTIHTAVYYPSMTACEEAMHSVVDKIELPYVYLEHVGAYVIDEKYVLICEGEA